MQVALVYDRVNKWGGAERLLLLLQAMFPKAPLFTSVYNSEKAQWASVFVIKTSFLQHFPFAANHHELYAPLMPLAFESFDFSGYDLVISLTSEAAKGIITNCRTKHVCICLTPTRYLWSGYAEYFKNNILKFLSKPIISYLRFWDTIAAQRPDNMLAISKTVQERIDKYYQRKSTIIYPPVAIAKSLIVNVRSSSSSDQRGFFLVVSRLSRFTQYKRIDIAIEAANQLGVNLKIVGDGDIAYFKQKANKNIEFLGQITDEELAFCYSNCKALIFPGNEDFGLVMAEAQAFGKPVIAFRAGGALEIIIEGKTGEFFNQQSADSLVETLQRFRETSYNRKDCVKNAERFSEERFMQKLKRITANLN